MTAYEVTEADRLPIPAKWSSEPRHLGYRDADFAKPYARYLLPEVLPIPVHAREALVEGMSPTVWGYSVAEAAGILERPGYQKLETGWTQLEDGTSMICILTRMPGVTAEMWDWWMAWHSVESQRYKLWHPDAHQFAAWGDDRSSNRMLTDRQRYVNNVSYVDEYLGGKLARLGIRFVDFTRLGFNDKAGHTVICGYGSVAFAPIGTGWVVHQVRPTGEGCEMRSRFWIGGPTELLSIPPSVYPNPIPARLVGFKPIRPIMKRLIERATATELPRNFQTDMIFHCASEMNHLASFLPRLYAEFKDQP